MYANIGIIRLTIVAENQRNKQLVALIFIDREKLIHDMNDRVEREIKHLKLLSHQCSRICHASEDLNCKRTLRIGMHSLEMSWELWELWEGLYSMHRTLRLEMYPHGQMQYAVWGTM